MIVINVANNRIFNDEGSVSLSYRIKSLNGKKAKI